MGEMDSSLISAIGNTGNQVTITKFKQYLMPPIATDIFKDANSNNFDLVRLIAAVMVIYGHSFAISPKVGHSDLIVRATAGIAQSGSVAVAVFFFLSGALVTRSMVESSTPWSFAKKKNCADLACANSMRFN